MATCPVDVPMPERIAALPRDERGFPIFAGVQHLEGDHDFKALDARVVRRLLEERRCGICAQPLGAQIVFIGGKESARNGVFSDPPSHKACLEYALKVCPYLRRPWDRRRTGLAERMSEVNPFAYLGPATRHALWYCRGYRLLENEHGYPLIQAAAADLVEWRWPLGRGRDGPQPASPSA